LAALAARGGMSYVVGMEAASPARRTSSPPRWLAPVPDLLTALRVLLAPVFVATLPDRPGIALAAAVLAAASDFVDGRLARRLGGGSRRGAALDVVADAVFVLTGFVALAASGVISPALPIATALSLSGLALSWRRRGAPKAGPRALPDRVGHAAGVVNYSILLIATGALAFAWPMLLLPLRPASVLVAVLNLLPLVLRRLRRGEVASAPSDPSPRS